MKKSKHVLLEKENSNNTMESEIYKRFEKNPVFDHPVAAAASPRAGAQDSGFELIKEFYQRTKFVQHQISQFNHFVKYELPKIISHEFPIHSEASNTTLNFIEVTVDRPYFTKKMLKRTTKPTTSKDYNQHSLVDNTAPQRPTFSGGRCVSKPKILPGHLEETSFKRSCLEITEDAALSEHGETSSYETCPLYPHDARLRNLSYDGNILLKLEVVTGDKKTIHDGIIIGKLPIMLHSFICWTSEDSVRSTESAESSFEILRQEPSRRFTTSLSGGAVRGAEGRHVTSLIPPSFQNLDQQKNVAEKNKILSKECMNDNGGYFIIKGKERVLVSQLRKAYNRVYVENEDGNYIAEMRSTNGFGGSILVQLKYNTTTNEFAFSLPYIKTKNFLPAGLIFKALGASEEEMLLACQSACYHNEYKEKEVEMDDMLLTQFRSTETSDDALRVIASCMDVFKENESKKAYKSDKPEAGAKHSAPGAEGVNEEEFYHDIQGDEVSGPKPEIKPKKTKFSTPPSTTKYVEDILHNELFYHAGKLNPKKSIIQLGFMIRKIKNTIKKLRKVDDKDNIANKRVDAASSLLSFLFQTLLKQFVKTVTAQIDGKKSPDIIGIMRDIKLITNALNQVFMTGNWNIQKNATFTRVGVSQVLNMQNYGAKISHLRRLMLPVGVKGKNYGIRQLHASHFAFICPYETPEGETVGIVSNLALSAHITTNSNTDVLMKEIIAVSTFTSATSGKFLIVLNGYIIGSCENSLKFIQEFEKIRLNPEHRDVSIVRLYNEREIHIESDEGRFIRPLFKVGLGNQVLYKHNDKRLCWDECVKQGIVVFRAAWELEQAVVAMNEDVLKGRDRYEYLEISPSSTMMGVMASVIPLSNHSQSPRIAYQASMGKQAIGIPSLAFQHRFDTTLHVLNYPQKPLVKTNMVDVLKFDEMSHGSIAIVAIMTFSGFNQEDSIILNKASLDRGLFTTTTYKTIVDEEKKKGKTDIECICLPDFQYRNRNYDYSYLNTEGLVWKEGVWLPRNTVIVGKIIKKYIKAENGERKAEVVDTSVVIKHNEEGFLDRVHVSVNSDGGRVVKIRVRLFRIPELGDKFASSTAQKGTCGMIFPEEDLPFDENGIRPDLIINPHAIPSRMTINMLIEMFFYKVGCVIGRDMDATPFKHRNIEQELKHWSALTNIKLETQTLFSGITGEKIRDPVYMAPCFYQRLKHLVSEKIHARISGPLDTLTHQPVAGRAKGGALRFGEMEKDAILGHGSTSVLKENLFDKSDVFHVPVCVECGKIPDNRVACNTPSCSCSSTEMKNMPYATKLLIQELAGMTINTSIK